ncbi:MAG: NAD(P)-dependent oxidoreductase [Paracoccaceae bacterium]|jgi:nucleoside-diphosphate-sugar epimerase|nr:NAD(P)-dependent oxidoreductase [Paracoccaceae bacterium]
MRLGVTGASGRVGRFVVADALARGAEVTVLGRRRPGPGMFPGPVAFRPHDLAGDAPVLDGLDAVVHCAFLHVPGRYRGGEGDDPDGFRSANLGGLARLIAAGRDAGLRRMVFLSSRAVYGRQPPGARLNETTGCHPDSLYGEVKLEAERMLGESGLNAVSLRATGVYGPAGPGERHKWADLFDAFARGEAVAPRVGSEVHGADVAAAVRLALTRLAPGVYNVSDILLDRADLLALWSEMSGVAGRIPDCAPGAGAFNEMDCTRLRSAGWAPGGRALLRRTLADLAGG